MSAAVAQSTQPPQPPMDGDNLAQSEVNQAQSTTVTRSKASPARQDIDPSIQEPTESSAIKTQDSNAIAQPLAPPPRPTQTQPQAEEGDYFSAGNKEHQHFSREPNPFEKSFGQSSSEPVDNKSLLPPVAALTSPAPLAPEGASTGSYNFSSSLRSGPLSPAMLGGPVGSGTDYFGPQAGTTFPGVTPNESSLRTGLTPGGGGSMFPAPSPNSTAYLQQLANGGTTPSTLDFHRTAMKAAAANNSNNKFIGSSSTSQDNKSVPAPMDPLLQQQSNSDTTFGQHDSDAANGLYLLAQATNGQGANQYPAPPVPNQRQAMEGSSNVARNAARNGSLNGSAPENGELSEEGEAGRMATRSKGKRNSGGKNKTSNTARRKADDTPAKQPPGKKLKQEEVMDDMDDDSDDDLDGQMDNVDTRKMTDEEKRKNFLERNRVAALKCRQRKKQWLQNLQAKVEMFGTENDSLTAQIHNLRDEVVALKTLLLQHKDCPISQSQGLHQYFQQQQEFNPHTNPYGMGLPNGHQGLQAGRR